MNITEEQLIKELERRFTEYKNMLTEQKEMSRELVRANEKLIESEALKTHFISSITNEIINPFSSILGLSRNLLMFKNSVPLKVHNMIKLIYTEAFSLDFQLKNIFTSAKIEAGELFVESSKVNIPELVIGVIESFKHETDGKSVSMSLRINYPQIMFYTDDDKLKLIISNLVSNAIKYTEKGEVLVGVDKYEDGIMITVKDNGIGISDSDREVIFDRFKRVDESINSMNRGHGLGLAIAKSLTELLNGSISLVSGQDNGSEFRLYIPESQVRSSIYGLFDEVGPENLPQNEVF